MGIGELDLRTSKSADVFSTCESDDCVYRIVPRVTHSDSCKGAFLSPLSAWAKIRLHFIGHYQRTLGPLPILECCTTGARRAAWVLQEKLMRPG